MATLRRMSGGEVLQKYRLEGESLLLGRDLACDIVLKGPGISRKHCKLTRSGQRYSVEDLGGPNGTMLGRTKLTGKQPLKDGDKIVIMGHLLVFTAADEEIEARPSQSGEPPMTSDEYSPTKEVDPRELNRRLNELLGDEGFILGPGGDDQKK